MLFHKAQFRPYQLLPAPPAAYPDNGRKLTDGVVPSGGFLEGKSVGWLGHQDGLKPQLTVIEQLNFFAHLYGKTADSALLEQVGLARQADLPCRLEVYQ